MSRQGYKNIIVILTIIICAGGYFGGNYLYDLGYKDGKNTGYESGYDDGYNQCYSELIDDIEEMAYYEPETTSDYLTTNDAPAGTVWVTPAGEKYHEGWCRYVSDRTDLSYFTSASEATNYGYTPCSVCH